MSGSLVCCHSTICHLSAFTNYSETAGRRLLRAVTDPRGGAENLRPDPRPLRHGRQRPQQRGAGHPGCQVRRQQPVAGPAGRESSALRRAGQPGRASGCGAGQRSGQQQYRWRQSLLRQPVVEIDPAQRADHRPGQQPDGGTRPQHHRPRRRPECGRQPAEGR